MPDALPVNNLAIKLGLGPIL